MDPEESQEALSDQVLHLAPEAKRAYDSVVRPNAILPVPRYFLNNWLPLLGSSRAWLTLAFRQVAFVSRTGSDEVPVRTTLRKLGNWCGLTHVRVHQVLKDPELLTWFVRNPHGDLSEHKGPRSQPTTYLVRSDIPLTPEDQARLTSWFSHRKPSDDDAWLASLEEAIQAKDLELPSQHPLPDIPRTVQQVVLDQRASSTPLPPSLDEACTELHARWVQPDRVTLVTHYFIRRWLPDLSAGLAWLIVLLRSRCYIQADTALGQVWISGGWTRLAADLGVSRKSLRRWSKSPDSKLFFERRPEVEDPGDRRSLLLAVRLSEPIHKIDRQKYKVLIKGQNSTSAPSTPGQKLTKPAADPGQSLTSCGEISPDARQNLTSSGQKLTQTEQELTKTGTKLTKTRTKLNALSIEKSLFKDSSQEERQQPVGASIPDSKTAEQSLSHWNLEKLLARAGVSLEIKESILNASPEKKQGFLAWMLFALTVPRIQYPVLFAHKRHQDSMPPEDYYELVAQPADQFMDWMVGKALDFPENLRESISQLRKQHAYQKLRDMGALHWEERRVSVGKEKVSSWAGAAAEEGDLAAPIEGSGISAERAWKAARGELLTALPKAQYDTWVKDIEVISFDKDTFLLGAANEYALNWLEKHLKRLAEETLTRILGKAAKVRFVTLDEA